MPVAPSLLKLRKKGRVAYHAQPYSSLLLTVLSSSGWTILFLLLTTLAPLTLLLLFTRVPLVLLFFRYGLLTRLLCALAAFTIR
jgi:hypothetical protein